MKNIFSVICLTLVLANLWNGSARASQPNPGLEQLLLAELVEKPVENTATLPTDKVSDHKSLPQRTNAEVASAVPSIPFWPVLVLCVALGAAAWWLRRRPAVSTENSIRKLAALPLGGKRALMVIEVMGERLLVGVSDHQLSLLANLDKKTTKEEKTFASSNAFGTPRGLLEDHEFVAEPYRPVPAEKQQLEEKFREFWSR